MGTQSSSALLVIAMTTSLLFASGASAGTSPTPQLGTGNYQTNWSLVVVQPPSTYSRANIAVGLHPTTVHYDSPSSSYTLSDGVKNYIFSPNEIVTSKTTAAYTFYRDSSTASTLQLLNDSSINPKIVLSYVTYGKWVLPPSSSIKVDDNYVVFGLITPPASVPRSGSASYKMLLDGTYVNAGGTYTLGGNASVVANFGAGTVAVTVAPVGTNISNGSKLSLGQFTAVGYINLAGSSFTANARRLDANGVVSRFSASGYLFGSQASEIGPAFTITQTLNNNTIGGGAGALVGKRN